MFPYFLLLSATLGINVGWEPLPDGGMKYILQLEPEALDAHKSGEPLESYVPAEVRDIRSVVIRLGTGDVARINTPLEEKENKQAAIPSWNKNAPENNSKSNPSNKPSISASSPPPILQNTTEKPLLAQPAGFYESSDPKNTQDAAKNTDSAHILSEPKNTQKAAKNTDSTHNLSEPAKPWTPLILVSILLFASVGGNMYLIWIFAELRKRYRATFAR